MKNGPHVTNYGVKQWYRDGKLHRDDGPAVEYLSGTKYWIQWGKLHRTDGPAVLYHDGTCEWWLNGKQYKTESEWHMKILSLTIEII